MLLQYCLILPLSAVKGLKSSCNRTALNFLMEFLVKQFVDLLACRDVQKQKALVKSESLLTILSGEFLPTALY